ncbi:MAG: NAD(P)H-dependent glycerol-3-phosphate dehydrogenase [Alteromonadaceae bacterium]|jgi:glycerol-3-phosphate dehydrogenase (NAD(P)+)|uniref:NAD(P)H-dependent glycerol-3-phosphate dehydrogenase n=1 Tax=Rheinheimera aquimaris TaxID=412437 RepID=UPI000C369475|nr:NAD(P)H-dependent glycerol-3-phosphate dehydrogenase [Rheinheimera aquimaris]MBJ91976.1 NAD(P)H-dependent glycerol-3-phosphate dehydrogenase [Alteromonadaceae bacterium]MBJ92817.1 NAD(P)H-dependent glycerol-3-phosphate dehydrogenase [Alteromonadaceae bacterium]HBN88007.1 NAD(P)H-dependent glycerol-3-phosphate dehydrogenase [Rheinheimera sp.]|tara:strand:- start:1274 stop:2281 length:1008 start_codon:yes stop_codon:yes gene_type:complete
MQPSAIAVLGAGSYGTALAICLARNGNTISLWGRNEEDMAQMAQQRLNQKYLPDIRLPDTLQVTADLAEAVASSRDILLVVPSHAFADTLRQIKPLLQPDARLAWATKGLEPETGRLLQDVARDILGDDVSLAVFSGPTFAKEMAVGMPTAISLSSSDAEFISRLSDLLHCAKSFRVYTNPDFIGVQLGGAVKNVIAIGAGMADGIGFGANARTALITRGLTEMCRLGCAMGAKKDTFMGMAGLGDLVLTCTDNQSRNRRFGLLLGQGQAVDAAMESIGQVVEGYRNAKEVYNLAQRVGVEMPITEQIYQVLYQGKDVKLAALDLLGREKRDEVS